jgi:CubicO group peptidase (beta-lactamase class C family)
MNQKILALVVLVISASFLACGQEHQQSKTWLNNFKEIEKTTVVLNNGKEILPLKDLEKKRIASIDLGFNHHIVFDSLLNKYDKVDHFNGSVYQANSQLKALIDDLKFYNTVILCLSDVSVFNEEVLSLIKELEYKKQVVIALFGDGRSLTRLDQFNAPIVYSPQHNNDGANFVAQLIFGGVGTEARMLTSYSEKYQKGAGSDLLKIRLKYTVPEDVGINTDDLKKIDAIAAEAIKEKAAPGMVVFIAKGGKVIFNKAYGYHTYEKETKSRIDDIFDLASITKTSATTMEVMRLYEQGQLNLDTSISAYISKTRKTNKQEIKVKEVMLHQAGFIPFIPFYNAMKPGDSSLDSTETYSVKVADSFYMKKDYYKDIMWKQMLESSVKTNGIYVYSDLSMYFMKEIVESISRQSLSSYVRTNFYDPLGMYTTGFNPRYRFPKSRIVPTENDEYFRNTLLWGYVHDQGAAMVGGVSGHAGLFSNASDLATLYQMLLNKGTYGGKTFFKPSTVELFTARQSNVSRRGLGFDRWDPEPNRDYPSKLASSQTYGHTGYTGTCVWVDPKDDLVYIFLSNRVNPKVTNQLSTLNIRPRIQDVIYEAIAKVNQKLN